MDLGGLAPIRKLDIGILRQALNSENVTTDESQAQSEAAELLPEIFRLLASLEDDTQKMLLDSWAKLEMPLNQKTVSQLIQYLENNPAASSEDKLAVIKAFAFLENNGLPFSEKLVDALRNVFNQNGNLSSDLETYMNSNNSLSSEQLNNLLQGLELNDIKNSLNNIENSIQESHSNLNQEIQNNFNENTLKILNNFLANNNITTQEEKTTLLKAFSFLENNKLPLTDSLIKEIFNNFQNENIAQMTEELNDKTEILSNLKNLNSKAISNRETALNLNNNAQQIAESLADQNKLSDQIMNLFTKTGGEDEDKIANNLVGQKLVNVQQQVQNTPLLLALEIPVLLKENKLSSLLLKVEKDDGNTNKEESSTKKADYTISFILEFENIGPIKSKIEINNKKINTSFFTESAKTAELIKNNFFMLRNALKKTKFEITNVHTKNFENSKEEKENFFNELILSELNKQDDSGKYRHIDIKI